MYLNKDDLVFYTCKKGIKKQASVIRIVKKPNAFTFEPNRKIVIKVKGDNTEKTVFESELTPFQ